jgi:hypothetical protein
MCLFTGTFFASAQTTSLHISLRNEKNDSVKNNSTVQLYLLPDTSLVTTKVAEGGTANFNVKKFTKYLVKISCIGYAAAERTINIADKPVSTTVVLKNATTGLKEVVVVARKPLIKQEDDKTIIDAEPLASSSTNAYEVLEKTPGAVVDQDGNVYLNSATPATIQINGREVKLSAADVASLLKSLPAGSVIKIEILRNPSAKYDAASSGGIVNIVLKKGVKLGTNGSVNAGYFQGVYATQTAGFNLNKGDDKLSTYLSYQFTNRNNYEELNSGRLTNIDTALSQTAYTTYPSTNNYIGAGIDYIVSKKLTIGYDARFSLNNSHSNADNASIISSIASPTIVLNNNSLIKNNNTSIYWGNNFSAKYKIDSAGSEWMTQVDLNYYNNKNNQQYNNNYFLPVSSPLFGNGNTNGRKFIFTAQSDLTLKFKHSLTVETGFKTTVSNSNNAALYTLQKGTNPVQTDPYQTNTFKYKEGITSLYAQVSKTFAGFTFKPGLRMETTNINGHQTIPTDTTLSIKRTDFFPYLYIRHRIAKMFGFELNGNLIYRRSISRPYYEALNPYPKYIDQYLFDVGNPKLQPQFTTNYEFNVMADDFPVFSAGINQTTNIFSQVTYQDQVTKIAYRTYDNLGKSKEFYLRAVGGIPPGPGKYFFYAGAQYNYVKYNGYYQGVPLNYNRGTWTFFMYNQYRVNKTLTASLGGFMRTKGLQNFYELQNFGALNISLNKSILKKKANIILSGNDILGTNKIKFSLDQGNVHASGERINDTRKIGITFRYNFGIKPKEEKKAMFEQPAEGN